MKSKHELLSLEYHRAIARKLRANPELLSKAVQTLERFRGLHGESTSAMAWAPVLERPLEQICEVLEDETEYADELRHASVFVGILTNREREEIYARFFQNAINKDGLEP
jgi:hypothetical protein